MELAANKFFTSWGIKHSEPIGLIFDIDGLLFDNTYDIFLAYRSLLDSRNIPIEAKETFPGANLFDIVSKIKNKYNIAEDIENLIEERKIKYINLLKETNSKPMRGVKELFNFIDSNRSKLDIRLAYVSSSEKAFVDIILKKIFRHCEMKNYLDNPDSFFYSDSNNCTASTCWKPGLEKKPSPMLYFKTIEKLGLPLRQCIAFEDSKSGLMSALAAGLNTIIIPSSSKEEEFNDLQFDEVYKNRIYRIQSIYDFFSILSLHLKFISAI